MSNLEDLLAGRRPAGGPDRSEPEDTDPAALARLHDALISRARAGNLIDVAYRLADSPFGQLLLAATPAGLVKVAYATEDHDTVLAQLADQVSPRVLHAPALLDLPARQLDEYFSHRRRHFDLPVDLQLAHGFRRLVLEQLPAVGYGRTLSYGQLAARVGNPRAARAVGTACSTNPVPLIVPCHRVIRSDGTVGEYVGGPRVKRALLELEAAR